MARGSAARSRARTASASSATVLSSSVAIYFKS
jgi:hypothetical protein